MTTPAIILEAQQPVFANNRAGNRKSILTHQNVDAPANVPDMETVGDVDYYGVVNDATNLITTVVDDWTIDLGTSITVTPLGGFVYEIDFDGATDSRISTGFLSGSPDRFGACQVRLTAGSVPGTLTSSYISFGFAATRQGASFDLTTLILGNGFIDADFTVPSGTFSDLTAIRGEAGTPFTIEVRLIRAVDGLHRAAAFPDNSIAGASYDVDVLTATPTIGTVGEIVQLYTPYSWNNDSAPTANPRLLNLTGGPSTYTIFRENAAEWQTAGTNSVVGEVTADMQTFAVNNWNGTVVFSEYRDGESGSIANNAAPGNALVLGNVGSGMQPFHGRVCCLIYDRILNDSERNIIEQWLRFGIEDRLLPAALGIGIGIGITLGMMPIGAALTTVQLVDDEAPPNNLVDDEIPPNVLVTRG